jgi:hypothetical protein
MLGFHNGAGILAGVPYLEPAVADIIRGAIPGAPA